MRKDYNIKLNPKQPSSEEIHRHMDFDSLLRQHQATPVREKVRHLRVRYLTYIGGAVAAAIALLLLYIGLGNAITPKVDEKAYFAERPFVNPPLDKVVPAYQSFQVNVNQGGVYEYASGSRIVVPAAAFMDDYGRLVEGEVDIIYREYHDYVDFFIGGIPMVYDSANIEYSLESAGMVEIYAEQNGQRVNIAPDKTIQVELVSEIKVKDLNELPRYNVYQLDTASRSWVYQNVDQLEFINEQILDPSDILYEPKEMLQTSIAKINQEKEKELAALEASLPYLPMPVKPKLAKGDQPTLELDFTDEDLVLESGEKNLYQGTIWQVSPNSPAFDERAFRVTWESTRLKKINDWEYELTLINGDNQVSLVVQPVLVGNNYNQALEKFDAAFSDYQAKLAEREAKLAASKQVLEQQTKAAQEAAYLEYRARLDSLRAQGLDFAATEEAINRKVINRFEATSLGIWGCDRPELPNVITRKAKFVDKDGNSLRNRPGYLVDKNRNTVYRFLSTDNAPLRYDTGSKTLLWLVTEDNKLAVFRPEDFQNLSSEKDNVILALDVIDQPIRDEKDVRKILEME